MLCKGGYGSCWAGCRFRTPLSQEQEYRRSLELGAILEISCLFCLRAACLELHWSRTYCAAAASKRCPGDRLL
jgi:hypothetical protein